MKNILKSIKGNVVERRVTQHAISHVERRKAIKELRSFSDSQLKDMGITRGSIVDCVKHGRKAA